MEGDENFTQNFEVDIPCMVPSTSNDDDCRINCTDSQSLRAILHKILHEIPELADSYNASDRSELITCFSDSFKNALQNNILLNGLPYRLDKSSKLTSPEKEDHRQMVDDALFSKLSKTVSTVAHQRKFCPEQCSRILNIEMKHDLQSLKKAKIVSSSTSSIPLSKDISCLEQSNVKKFSEFCKAFNSIQESIQCKTQDLKKLKMEISLALHIKKQQRHPLKSDS